MLIEKQCMHKTNESAHRAIETEPVTHSNKNYC